MEEEPDEARAFLEARGRCSKEPLFSFPQRRFWRHEGALVGYMAAALEAENLGPYLVAPGWRPG